MSEVSDVGIGLEGEAEIGPERADVWVALKEMRFMSD